MLSNISNEHLQLFYEELKSEKNIIKDMLSSNINIITNSDYYNIYGKIEMLSQYQSVYDWVYIIEKEIQRRGM